MGATLRLGRQHPLALVCVAAVLATLVAALFLWLLRPSEGPFAEEHSSHGGYNTIGGPVLPNQFFDAGLISVPLEGSQPAILDSITPLHPEQARGLELRYATLLDGSTGADRGWPPRGELRPVQGTVIQPAERASIWVGAASPSVGNWQILGFVLRYHVGRGHYSSTIYQGMKVRVVSHCAACAD